MVDSGGDLVAFREEGARGISNVEFDGWFVLVIVVLNAMMRTMRNDDPKSYITRNPAGGWARSSLYSADRYNHILGTSGRRKSLPDLRTEIC
jgi:hypothetical protein